MKKYITLVFILFAFVYASAQSISVKSFRALSRDMTASSLEGKRIDQNGEVAALIKIETSETGFAFDGGYASCSRVSNRGDRNPSYRWYYDGGFRLCLPK